LIKIGWSLTIKNDEDSMNSNHKQQLKIDILQNLDNFSVR
jgi:hypothetical protein